MSDRNELDAFLNRIDNELSSIFCEYDDFFENCSPGAEQKESPEEKISQNFIKYAISSKHPSNEFEIENLKDDDEKLNEIFKMQSANANLAVEEELNALELQNDLKLITEISETVKEALETKESKKVLIKIRHDFEDHRKILKNVVIKTFTNHADEVLTLLDELFQRHFNANDEYFNLTNENYQTEVIQKLISIGIVECDPEDENKIKLRKLVG